MTRPPPTSTLFPYTTLFRSAHTLAFTGTDPTDKTTFIDNVALNSTGLVATTTRQSTRLNSRHPSTKYAVTATETNSAPTGSVGFTADGITLTGCGAVALPAG